MNRYLLSIFFEDKKGTGYREKIEGKVTVENLRSTVSILEEAKSRIIKLIDDTQIKHEVKNNTKN